MYVHTYRVIHSRTSTEPDVLGQICPAGLESDTPVVQHQQCSHHGLVLISQGSQHDIPRQLLNVQVHRRDHEAGGNALPPGDSQTHPRRGEQNRCRCLGEGRRARGWVLNFKSFVVLWIVCYYYYYYVMYGTISNKLMYVCLIYV